MAHNKLSQRKKCFGTSAIREKEILYWQKNSKWIFSFSKGKRGTTHRRITPISRVAGQHARGALHFLERALRVRIPNSNLFGRFAGYALRHPNRGTPGARAHRRHHQKPIRFLLPQYAHHLHYSQPRPSCMMMHEAQKSTNKHRSFFYIGDREGRGGLSSINSL